MSFVSASTGYGPKDPAYRRITAALFLAGLATFATIYCTQPLLPILAREFEISPTTAALSVSVTTICLGISLLIAGPLSDAIGRTRLMQISLVASGLACLASAFVTDWVHMIWLRALVGVLVAGLPAVATAYLREEIHHHWATAATGLYIGGTAIGGMAGRFITGFLATVLDWRAAIAGIGITGIVIAVAVSFLLPPSQRFKATPLNLHALADNARRMVFDRGLLTLYAIGFTTMGSFVAVFNVFAFRLFEAPYHLTPAAASLLYLSYAIGSFSSTVAGRLAARFGSRPIVPLALAIDLVGVLLTLAEPLWVIGLGVALISIGFFAAHGVTSAWVTARASRKGPGTAMAGGLYLFCYYLGSSICGAFAGAFWTLGGWPAVVTMAASVIGVGIVLALSMRWVPQLPYRIQPKPTEH